MKKAKKKKGKRKQNTKREEGNRLVIEEQKWLTFETMKEAIDAGWKVSLFLFASTCNNETTFDCFAIFITHFMRFIYAHNIAMTILHL